MKESLIEIERKVKPIKLRESPFLIGRDRELALLSEYLDSSSLQPALIIITGKPCMGKSSLLMAVGKVAKEARWNVAHSIEKETLCVKPATTPETFQKEVQELLPSFDGISKDSSQMQPLMEQLTQMAPVLLLVDSYRPNTTFDDWFKTTFLSALNEVKASIVIIVADQREYTATLEAFAKKNMVIGPLENRALRRHFAAIGRLILPPMRKKEIEIYVNASCQNPEMLRSLNYLLQLAVKEEKLLSK